METGIRAETQILIAACGIAFFVSIVYILVFIRPEYRLKVDPPNYGNFIYATFLKPHEKSSEGGQQDALESFYRAQVRQAIRLRFQ